MKKIRILAYDDSNNGSCLISWAVSQLLAHSFSDYDVKLLDYAPFNRRLSELLRTLKPHRGNPFFNWNRNAVLSRWIKTTLSMESHVSLSINKYLGDQKFDVVVVCKPSWDITDHWALRGFPTPFWLPQDLPSKKVAFGVSAHRSIPDLVHKHRAEIRAMLDTFSLIGVRDDWTYEIVSSSGTHAPLWKVPDPVFMYEFIDTGIASLLEEEGVDLNRPMIAFAGYGKDGVFRELASHFRKNGYQILGLSMFNPHVDLNLGDVLDPFQWADVYRHLSFCVTDRYHGTIMSLLADVPFVSMEPYYAADRRNSKIHDLLKNVARLDCYADIYNKNFRVAELIEKIESLRKHWKESHSVSVDNLIHEKRSELKHFIDEMQTAIH